MSKIINFNNPLDLKKKDILEYLNKVKTLGIAEYECHFKKSNEYIDNLIEAQVELELYEEELEERTNNLIFEEILPYTLIEDMGYICWIGKSFLREYKRKDYLIGTIIEEPYFPNRINVPIFISIDSNEFKGLNLFENYSNYKIPHPSVVIDNNRKRQYVIKDIYEENLKKRNVHNKHNNVHH